MTGNNETTGRVKIVPVDDSEYVMRGSPMIDWQPIATAPRDGTVVLLCGGKTWEWFCGEDAIDAPLKLRPVTGFWRREEDEFGDDDWCVSYWDSGWRSMYRSPTHWAPLNLPEGGTYV